MFKAVYPTDEKELYNFKNSQSRILRVIVLMQLYACAPRKVNDESDLDSVLDCLEDFKAIWEHGGKRSQADRQGKGPTESSVITLLVKLTKQSTQKTNWWGRNC